MSTSNQIFLAADYSQLESWLTAHFAQDDVMLGELKEQLHGGPKIHARNAAMIYEIDVADAKTHMVKIKGRDKQAYDGGKRASHLWNYGGKGRMIAKTLWLPLKFALEIEEKLAAKYVKTAQWRQDLADEVFGLGSFACGRCGYTREGESGSCPTCSTTRFKIQLRWTAWSRDPAREMYTVFGRRRLYPGRRGESMNSLASQKPQSCGASIWWRTLMRLHGIDIVGDQMVHWPRPKGWHVPELPRAGCCVDPMEFVRAKEGVTSGTYDSYLVECAKDQSNEVADWLTWTMEQPWSELNGLVIPCEMKWGQNYGEQNEHNEPGLKDFPRAQFEGAFERRSVA